MSPASSQAADDEVVFTGGQDGAARLDQAEPIKALPASPSFHAQLKVWLCDNEPAITLMEDLLFIAARWDDLIDRDQVLLDSDIHHLMETALSLPCNSFFVQHFASLYPLLHNAIRNWKVSLELERNPLYHPNQDARELALINAFILRSSYIDVLGQCACILAGNTWAEHVTRAARLRNSQEGFALYRQNLAREQQVRAERDRRP